MNRSANYCFSEYNHFKYALRVLEKAADYREQLEKFSLDKNITDKDAEIFPTPSRVLSAPHMLGMRA